MEDLSNSDYCGLLSSSDNYGTIFLNRMRTEDFIHSQKNIFCGGQYEQEA